MQAANLTPLQFVYGPSTSVSTGASTGPNTAGAVEMAPNFFCRSRRLGCGRRTATARAGTRGVGAHSTISRLIECRVAVALALGVCGLTACKATATRAVSSRPSSTVENADVRIHRCHFYPIHLTVTATGRVQILHPSEFNADQSFVRNGRSARTLMPPDSLLALHTL